MIPWKLGFAIACAHLAHALDTGLNLNFDTAVQLTPSDAWGVTNESCSVADHFTAQVGASASFSFTGDRFQLTTIGTPASGSIFVLVNSPSNGSLLVSHDLYLEDSSCGQTFDYSVPKEGTYNVTITLIGPSNATNDPLPPEMHLTGISIFVSDTPDDTNTTLPAGDTTSDPPSSPSTSSHTGAIVGGVIGAVVLLALLLVLFSILRRRKVQSLLKRNDRGRHMFDPTRPANTVYISELSPRTGSATRTSSFDADPAKLQPYAILEEGATPHSADLKTANPFYQDSKEVESPFGLAVPTLAYATPADGMGVRSRSPVRRDERDHV